ncbi:MULTISPECIES: DUF3486 family protein [Citromicrobium]|uniref:DUF3486 family protein n=1 Tax=Citromicrobium TaxID=72173 RepID=UPI0001DD10D3|nr:MULTISPECIES: DUF3486 family protein [Citromicrobium]ALG60893.1 hypothetical protein WG74_08640 [Citromicrobium sp. JL477]
MSAADRRQGRGRLSSIDMLPEEAEEDVVWALEALREHKLPQNTIREEFNARLIAKDIEPISKSAFNRYAVRKAIQFRKMDEVRRISSELVETLGTDAPDDVTVLVAEMIKVSMFKILEDKELDPKAIMELSRALQSTVSAQRGSEEYRKQLEKRVAQQLEEAADRAEVKMREAGLPADRIAQLRKDFLGVKS